VLLSALQKQALSRHERLLWQVPWEHPHLQGHALTEPWQQLQTLRLQAQKGLFRNAYVPLQAAFLFEVRKLPHDFQSGQVQKKEIP
jgi:hypothetical protein